jgi:hypothetical protein
MTRLRGTAPLLAPGAALVLAGSGAAHSLRDTDARHWAAELHRHQWRKGKPAPCIAQLIAVSALVWEDGAAGGLMAEGGSEAETAESTGVPCVSSDKAGQPPWSWTRKRHNRGFPPTRMRWVHGAADRMHIAAPL